jgi:hypothetical protein
MTTTEKNTLIVLFMGGNFKLTRSIPNEETARVHDGIYSIDEIKYDSDWNWLIPVLKKIDELLYASYVDLDDTIQDFIKKWRELEHKSLQFTNNQLKFGTDINEVYDDVIDFINFYNKYTNE